MIMIIVLKSSIIVAFLAGQYRIESCLSQSRSTFSATQSATLMVSLIIPQSGQFPIWLRSPAHLQMIRWGCFWAILLCFRPQMLVKNTTVNTRIRCYVQCASKWQPRLNIFKVKHKNGNSCKFLKHSASKSEHENVPILNQSVDAESHRLFFALMLISKITLHSGDRLEPDPASSRLCEHESRGRGLRS